MRRPTLTPAERANSPPARLPGSCEHGAAWGDGGRGHRGGGGLSMRCVVGGSPWCIWVFEIGYMAGNEDMRTEQRYLDQSGCLGGKKPRALPGVSRPCVDSIARHGRKTKYRRKMTTKSKGERRQRQKKKRERAWLTATRKDCLCYEH